MPSQKSSLSLPFKMDEEIHIMKVQKSISLSSQETSLSLSSKIDEEIQITEIEKSMSRSKEVAQLFFEIPTPHPSVIFHDLCNRQS